MNLSFKKDGVVHNPLVTWELSDGNYVSIYQGSRGHNPELDYIVKYKTQKSRLRAPSHTHWIVDLLLKCEHTPDGVKSFVNEWLEIYEVSTAFSTVEERNGYNLIYNEYFNEKYDFLNNLGVFSIEFLSAMIELFIKCEKQTPNAFMFKNLLTLVKEYCEGKKDFYQIVSYSKRV